MSTIGEWIRNGRVNNFDEPMYAFAKRVGVSVASINNWENDYQKPSKTSMGKLEKHLGPYRESIAQTKREQRAPEDIEDYDDSGLNLREIMGDEIKCIGTFDPNDTKKMPSCAGIYLLYGGNNNQIGQKRVKFTGNPDYIGQGDNIKTRVKAHTNLWWFEGVNVGVYVEIDWRKPKLRKHLETILIKLLSPGRNVKEN